MEYLVISLLVFMLIAVLIAVEARDLLSSVISLGAGGFALSVLFLLLGAPDLAITQVVVEVIALVLLIRLVVTRRDTTSETPRDALRTGLVLLAGGVLLVGMFFAVGGTGALGTVPPFGEPIMGEADLATLSKTPGQPVAARYLTDAAGQTGAGNAVMAVLLDFRAYDTLGEATVIFVSILGAYAVLRRVGRRGHQELAS
ncbi:MAG TPA: hydrogen gas-evolving membrane-bound hydrogenase subunit E [Phycisphaerae bacterium]|nr:hydrogen gas-evolving membrane-bound hydrogenase subunit E [Phycisphaerae bacterium]